MNIKNEEAHRLALELAAITGESITSAVTQALRERLERVRPTRGAKRVDRMLQIGRLCASHIKTKFRSIDHGEMLFGDDGLPQ